MILWDLMFVCQFVMSWSFGGAHMGLRTCIHRGECVCVV
jgi:hypothetical protein